MSSTSVAEGGGSPSAARSLIRRLRSKASLLPLRASRRALTDFHIQLNDPHRVYSPTDVVKGFVCITAERALAITHLTACLVGCVNVCTSTREAGNWKHGMADWGSTGLDGLRTGNCGTGFGYGNFNICWDEIVLCGQGRLEPGVYKFGFELEFCKLPGIAGLPTSLDVCAYCDPPPRSHKLTCAHAVRERFDILHHHRDPNPPHRKPFDIVVLHQDLAHRHHRHRPVPGTKTPGDKARTGISTCPPPQKGAIPSFRLPLYSRLDAQQLRQQPSRNAHREIIHQAAHNSNGRVSQRRRAPRGKCRHKDFNQTHKMHKKPSRHNFDTDAADTVRSDGGRRRRHKF